MGLKVEFNPSLALRASGDFENGTRQKEECLPETLVVGQHYPFLKRDQRIYWIGKGTNLSETAGNEALSKPLAEVIIREATHFQIDDTIWTKGYYEVMKLYE